MRLGVRWLAAAAAVAGLCAAAGLASGVTLVSRLHAQAPAIVPLPIPVGVAKVTQRDVPVHLVGIGNVQALYSVLVRARVDGYLDRTFFAEGQEVHKGDLLAIIDPRPYQASLDQAIAQKAKDDAGLVAARLDLVRYQHLARTDFAPRQQVDDQQGAVDQLIAAIKGDQANIEAAALNLSYTRLVSPIDGKIGLRMVDPGNLIHATDSAGIITITQIRPITAVFTLPEEALPQVTAAMRAGVVPVLAYLSDHRTRLAEGRLLTPNNSVDATTGTIQLKAIFDNVDNALWPGAFVEARVEVRRLAGALTVPEAAVQRGQSGLFVFVVQPDERVALRPVKEALEQDGTAVITEGLQAGETVVTSGQSRLQNGTRVATHADAVADHTGSGG